MNRKFKTLNLKDWTDRQRDHYAPILTDTTYQRKKENWI